MKKNKVKNTTVQNIVLWSVFVLFALYAISIVVPIFWMIMNSLKTAPEYRTGQFFPGGLEFANFSEAFNVFYDEYTGVDLFGMIFNSIWYSVGGALLGVICSTFVAYSISKYRFVGRKLLSAIAIAVMIIPIVGALPSQYSVFETLQMTNSPLILLSMTSGFGMNYLVMLAAFDNLSWDYAEASFMDGAGHMRVFIQVMLPQVMPIFTALFLVAFIGIWNDYMSPLIFMPDIPMLATSLYEFKSLFKKDMDLSMPVYFTGVFLCFIPAFVLFMVFQNTIMDISLSGGVKE